MLIVGHGKLLIGSNKFSATRIIKLGLFLISLLIIAGCASRHLVPAQDGALINPELKSATKTEGGVSITVQASAWGGKPSDIESYVTPLYVVIQNHTSSILSFGYENVMILDENRTQYNPLPAETVAQIVQSTYERRFFYRPRFSLGFGFSSFRFHRFNSFFSNSIFFDPFYDPFYYRPTYYTERFDDVFTKALFPGLVQPNAKLEGFVYFKKIPTQVERVMLEISYRVNGEQEPHKFSFPFVIEESRH